MANSKVQLANGTVLIDLTQDTITATSLTAGTTAHGANGEAITGSLVVQYYRVGSSEPSASMGNNGDLYLKI